MYLRYVDGVPVFVLVHSVGRHIYTITDNSLILSRSLYSTPLKPVSSLSLSVSNCIFQSFCFTFQFFFSSPPFSMYFTILSISSCYCISSGLFHHHVLCISPSGLFHHHAMYFTIQVYFIIMLLYFIRSISSSCYVFHHQVYFIIMLCISPSGLFHHHATVFHQVYFIIMLLYFIRSISSSCYVFHHQVYFIIMLCISPAGLFHHHAVYFTIRSILSSCYVL